MKRSESSKEISLALSKAQGEMPIISFDRQSHNNRYASLTAIVDGTQATLAKHGLSIIQTFTVGEKTNMIVTSLLHQSGEWLEDDGVPLIVDKQNMQGLGSAITYAKRYGMSAMLRIVTDEDDDGNASMLKSVPAQRAEPMAKQATVNVAQNEETGVGDFVVKISKKYKDKTFNEIGLDEVLSFAKWLTDESKTSGKQLSGHALDLTRAAKMFEEEQMGQIRF